MALYCYLPCCSSVKHNELLSELPIQKRKKKKKVDGTSEKREKVEHKLL